MYHVSKLAADAHRTIANSVELKKASIQKLKRELEKIESDTEVKLREIDGSNTELKVSCLIVYVWLFSSVSLLVWAS